VDHEPLLEAAGAVSLLALLLLPGLLVVRAPWTAVPALSLAFWIASWAWLEPLARGRTRFLHVAFALFGALVILRLLKPLGAGRPSAPALAVAAAAALRALPYVFWPVAPGGAAAMHALLALLLVWRDGVPRTCEPLLPVAAFDPGALGFTGLSADVSLLSGLPAPRAAFLVGVVAHGLVQIAVYALLRTWLRPRCAALGSLLALATSGLPQGLLTSGEGHRVMALALLVSAGALLVRGRSRAPAVAAGLMIGAAWMTDVSTTAVLAALVPLALRSWRRALSEERSRILLRFGIAAGFAVLAAAPHVVRWLARSLTASVDVNVWLEVFESPPEPAGRSALAELGAGPGAAFVVVSAAGAWIAVRRRWTALWPVALSACLLVGLAALAGRAGVRPVAESALVWLGVLLALPFAAFVQALDERPRWLRVGAVLALAGLAVHETHRHYRTAAASRIASTDDRAAFRWIRGHTAPLDRFCVRPGTAGLWIPAATGRGLAAPRVRGSAPADDVGGCDYTYGPRCGPGVWSAGEIVFENTSVIVRRAASTRPAR
jgi:hypothetical protein